MRPSLPLLVMTVWTVAPVAWSQTTAPQAAVTGQSASEPPAAQPSAARPTTIQPAAAQSNAAQSNAAQPSAAPSGAVQQSAGGPNAGAAGAAEAAAAGDGETSVTHAPRRSSSRHARSPDVTGTAPGSAPAGKSAGVLSLGATDITGNKELPKVMVIVPWKDSMGASGVIPPTDSLMDEALEPVDRGVFQRRIRYYGQLNAAEKTPEAGKVAPVGDNK